MELIDQTTTCSLFHWIWLGSSYFLFLIVMIIVLITKSYDDKLRCMVLCLWGSQILYIIPYTFIAFLSQDNCIQQAVMEQFVIIYSFLWSCFLADKLRCSLEEEDTLSLSRRLKFYHISSLILPFPFVSISIYYRTKLKESNLVCYQDILTKKMIIVI